MDQLTQDAAVALVTAQESIDDKHVEAHAEIARILQRLEVAGYKPEQRYWVVPKAEEPTAAPKVTTPPKRGPKLSAYLPRSPKYTGALHARPIP